MSFVYVFLLVVQTCKYQYIKYIQKVVHKYTNWGMYFCEYGVNYVSLLSVINHISGSHCLYEYTQDNINIVFHFELHYVLICYSFFCFSHRTCNKLWIWNAVFISHTLVKFVSVRKRKHGLWVETFSLVWKYVQNMTVVELGQGDRTVNVIVFFLKLV